MGKTSTAIKDRWNAKAYDDLRIRIPKGRKAEVEAYVKANGLTINGWVNKTMRETLGMTEEEWKASADTGEE